MNKSETLERAIGQAGIECPVAVDCALMQLMFENFGRVRCSKGPGECARIAPTPSNFGREIEISSQGPQTRTETEDLISLQSIVAANQVQV